MAVFVAVISIDEFQDEHVIVASNIDEAEKKAAANNGQPANVLGIKKTQPISFCIEDN